MNKEPQNGLGGRFADMIAAWLGSWPFIIGQTLAIVVWMTINTLMMLRAVEWDPYPFILLNLLFSIQAAYTGPILLISNNRQEALQRAQEETGRKQLLYILHIVEALRDHIMLARPEAGGLGQLTVPDENTNPKE